MKLPLVEIEYVLPAIALNVYVPRHVEPLPPLHPEPENGPPHGPVLMDPQDGVTPEMSP